MTEFKMLLSPMTFRGKVYRNRMIAAPTLFAHSVYFIPDIRENVYCMVERRAEGGFAAVSTGELPANCEEGTTSFVDGPIDYTKFEGEIFEETCEYARRIKSHGAIAYLEFSHEGCMANVEPPYQPWGPVSYTRDDGVQVLGMDEAMMAKVEEDFRRVGEYARKCGFDGVLVHGGHGFLLQQFVSPYFNTRTDEYGGSAENRAKFPKRLLQAVRKGIGEDGILEFRFSAEDGIPGGMTIDDTVEFMRQIDGIPDIVHVSNGLKWRGNHTKTFSSFLDPHGLNAGYAAKVRQALEKSKVSVIGGFNSPELCEEILEKGWADFIEFGRQGFADPSFPNKIRDGQADHIRRCVRCFNCYPGSFEHPTDVPLTERGWTDEQVRTVFNPAAMGRCAINPESGFDLDPRTLPPVVRRGRVLVAGGGAAGLQAALTAVSRGHEVTLVEKSGRLGGIINFTDGDGLKADLRYFKDMLIREVNESKADVRLNTDVTEELLAEVKPDTVIIATGSLPFVPPIPGIGKAEKILDAYAHPEKLGKRVAVAGGGLAGCEFGLFLAEEYGLEISVIEMKDLIAPELYCYYRNALLEHMDAAGIRQYTGTKCLSFDEDGVNVLRDGKEEKILADSVVYSFGMRANDAEADRITACVRAVCPNAAITRVGDAKRARKIVDAVHDGYLAAMEAGTA